MDSSNVAGKSVDLDEPGQDSGLGNDGLCFVGKG